MPVILATRDAKIRKIMVQSQARQIVWGNPVSKIPTQNKVGIIHNN
jgi:hypothetical protein